MNGQDKMWRLISLPIGEVNFSVKERGGEGGHLYCGEAEYLGSMRREGKWRDYWRVTWDGEVRYVFTERA